MPNAATAKPLGLSLEDFHDKLESFGRRLAPRADYADIVRRHSVAWQGVVFRTRLDDPHFAVVSIHSAKNPLKYGLTFVEFVNPTPVLLHRLTTLESDDVIEVNGTIYDCGSADVIIQATDFSLLNLGGSAAP